MKSFLRKLLGKSETQTPPEPIPTDYGYGFEAKELVNGEWVLMHDGKACDLKVYSYSWIPGNRFYKDCIGTRKQIDEAAKEIMAAHGVFK